MIERKPPPTPKRSLKSLEAGLALFPHFRKHISLSGPVTATQVATISEATGLKERQIRTLAARYSVKRRSNGTPDRRRRRTPLRI